MCMPSPSETTPAVTAVDCSLGTPVVRRRTLGWWPIWVWAVVHNVVAARTRREMLSHACSRCRREHPVVVPLAALILLGHLMGWLGRADPLTWVGGGLERILSR